MGIGGIFWDNEEAQDQDISEKKVVGSEVCFSEDVKDKMTDSELIKKVTELDRLGRLDRIPLPGLHKIWEALART